MEVDRSDGDVSEDDVEDTVGLGWPQSDGFCDECLGDPDKAGLEADSPIVVDPANDVVGRVVEGLDELTEGPRAGKVALSWHGQVESIVRSMVIVAMAPRVEGQLGLVEIGE